MNEWCCSTMQTQAETVCSDHPDRFDCPDALIAYSARFREYGLVIHDGGSAVIGIEFCPWCGTRLPESERNRWFEELERRGVDDADAAPDDMLDERWLEGSVAHTRAPSVRVLSAATNHLVIQTQDRRFPGMVLQGDRLHNWARLASAGVVDSLEWLYDELIESVQEYDRVCAEHDLLYEPRVELPDQGAEAMAAVLDVRQAFAALTEYLWQYARRAGDDLLTLLGDVELLEDGGPTDPAAWTDWLECVAHVKAELPPRRTHG